MASPDLKNINIEQLQRFGGLELLAKQVVEGFIVGLHKSPFHGFSVEFSEHRLYNKGESTRHIDWKLFGRTDKLFTKRYEEETNLRCQLVIDNSSSMYFPEEGMNKIQFSVYCAAAIMELLKKQRDACGLTLFSAGIEKHTQAKSAPVHLRLLFNMLEQLLSSHDLNKRTSAAKALDELSEAIHRRSLVIIFSDMLDNSGQSEEMFSALQHLRYNKHEVVLFHTVDKRQEIDFDFANQPYLFTDMETGEKIKVNPAEIKDFYQKQMQAYQLRIRERCAMYQVDYVEADIREGFHPILQSYLTKRQKMR